MDSLCCLHFRLTKYRLIGVGLAILFRRYCHPRDSGPIAPGIPQETSTRCKVHLDRVRWILDPRWDRIVEREKSDHEQVFLRKGRGAFREPNVWILLHCYRPLLFQRLPRINQSNGSRGLVGWSTETSGLARGSLQVRL